MQTVARPDARILKLPPGAAFAVLCGVSLTLWIRPLLETFALGMSDDQYTHVLLILPVTIALVGQRLIEQGGAGRGFASRPWSPPAALLVVAVLFRVMVGWAILGLTPDLRLAIAMFGLVLWWIASFLLCFGRPVLQAFRFPLFFLFWMVPLPKIFLDWIVAALQHGSALAAHLLFSILRVPVTRDGTILVIPGLELEVAAECSSIRSSVMLLVTTMALAQVLLKTPWRKFLLVLIAVPLSVAKNGLRIVTIALLGTRVDPGFLTGRLHHQGGIVFLLIALALILLLLWILRRGEHPALPAPQPSPAKS